MVGFAGTVAGWALGYGLTELLASIEFEIEGFVRSEGFILDYSIKHYIIAGVMGVAAATLAAYIPARKAAAMDPLSIIRSAS